MFKIVIRHNRVPRVPQPLTSMFSTKPAVKPDETEERKQKHEHQLKQFEKISNITRKFRQKKPQKPPFVKNIMAGHFDTDILAYPQLEKDEWKRMEDNVKDFRLVLKQNPDYDNLPIKKLQKQLAHMKLLGLQAPQLMGGSDSLITETCRYHEVLSEHLPKAKNSVILNENLGIQILLKFGSDSLKRKYLQRLVDGDSISSFCNIVRPLSNITDPMKRTALLQNDQKTWVIGGQRECVVGGSDADFFIVFAMSDVVVKGPVSESKLTAFVVDRDQGGVTVTRQKSVSGHFDICDVKFEDTAVSYENIIGKVGEGEQILRSIYPEYQLGIGPMCATTIKTLINRMTDHYIELSDVPEGHTMVYETEAVQSQIGKLACSLYAVESVIYLTAGLLDTYENQDCQLESTIVKIFSTQEALRCSNICVEMLGPSGASQDNFAAESSLESLVQITQNDTNDNLKFLISMFGLKHAGESLASTVKKLRNPLFHSGLMFKRMWTHRKQVEDNPNLILYLHQDLHPSLVDAANLLEYSVLRVQFAVETLFTNHGLEIMNKHEELRRLAECAIDVYVMTACLGRASRSYCIGLQHSELEMAMATSFCVDAKERVKKRVAEIVGGHYVTNDNYYGAVAERVFNFKQYFTAHPTQLNY